MIDHLRMLALAIQDPASGAEPDTVAEAIQTDEQFLFLALPELWLLSLIHI